MGVILNSNYTQPLGSNGQLLIGKAGDLPVVSTLSAGNNVTITNAPGSISIAADMKWQNSTGGTLVPFNGYNTSGSGPFTFTLPTGTVAKGDIYSIIAAGDVFSVNTGAPGQFIGYNGAAGSTIGTAVLYASITLICIVGSDLAPGTEAFMVLNTNASTFTVT